MTSPKKLAKRRNRFNRRVKKKMSRGMSRRQALNRMYSKPKWR